MALFKAKTKNVDFYETEASLPPFYVDTNGFIMFEDPNLGGAAVLEVATHIATESLTHEDPVHNVECTELDVNPDYEPSADALFSDARQLVYPAWAFFLNSLQMQDSGDEPTHVQLLMKKCTAKEWDTRIDYALHNAYRDYADDVERSVETDNVHEALLGARAFDYITLLETLQEEINASPSMKFDVRKLSSYITKFYLVVSYTPSSEGWWMDGRDTDYYITDNNIVNSLFKENESGDKMTERIVNIIRRKADKKERGETGGQEDDFFWIRSDRTAQVLATRVHKLYDIIDRWNEANPAYPMPFKLTLMDGRETAALVSFFPDILTPYWDRIWELQSNQNEVLYTMDAQHAIDLRDTSFVDQTDLVRAIANDTVDMRHSAQEQQEFLAKYKDKSFEELGTLADERAALNWTAEGEEEELLRQQELEAQRSADNDVWGRLDENDVVSTEHKTESEKRDEFLNRWRNQGPSDARDIRPTEERRRKMEEAQRQRKAARRAANFKPTFDGKPTYTPNGKPVFMPQQGKPVFTGVTPTSNPQQHQQTSASNTGTSQPATRGTQQRQATQRPQGQQQSQRTQQQAQQRVRRQPTAGNRPNGQAPSRTQSGGTGNRRPQQAVPSQQLQQTRQDPRRAQQCQQQIRNPQQARPQQAVPTPIDDDVDPFA